MAITGKYYANAVDQAFTGKINVASDALKMLLLATSDIANTGSHVHYSDISADELATGNGYTVGGATLTSVTHTVTTGSSWATQWAATTAEAVGALVRPATANGYLYVCTTAGTTGSTAPTWPTAVNATVTDGTVTWACVGEAIWQLSSAAVQWTAPAGNTLAAVAAAIYDSTPGSAATDPLITAEDFGGTISATGSTYTISPPAVGWAYLTLA